MPASSGTHEQDLLVVRNILPKDFTAAWGGQPFTILANGEKVYPRFIAEHMAKHMTDAALLQREEDIAKKQGISRPKYSLLNNKQMRDEIMATILPKVYQSYLEQPRQTEQERVAQQIESASADYFSQKVEEAPPEAPAPPSDTTVEGTSSDVSLLDPKKKKPTKAQLIADCENLGIDLTGDETYNELVAKIQAF